MVSQRSIGICSLALFWQLVLVTLSFWVWLFIWQKELFGDRLEYLISLTAKGEKLEF